MSPSAPTTETQAQRKPNPGIIAKPNEAEDGAAGKEAPKPLARTFPESFIRVPDKDSVSRRLEYNTMVGTRPSSAAKQVAWEFRTVRGGKIVGFEFSNQGGNPILPPQRNAIKNQFFTRDFEFRFDERARQDIYLMVSDWVPSRDRSFHLSEVMNSLMLFFPRKYLPAIVNAGERDIVTLPTGEAVEFDAVTHEIRGGVFSEAPVDLNPERAARRFPAIDYRGEGVVVRVNARGADPRIATVATITTGTPPEYCNPASGCNRCQVPSKELWDQTGAVRFKFATDAELERFLIARCGFGLPMIANDPVASTVQ